MTQYIICFQGHITENTAVYFILFLNGQLEVNLYETSSE